MSGTASASDAVAAHDSMRNSGSVRPEAIATVRGPCGALVSAAPRIEQTPNRTAREERNRTHASMQAQRPIHETWHYIGRSLGTQDVVACSPDARHDCVIYAGFEGKVAGMCPRRQFTTRSGS